MPTGYGCCKMHPSGPVDIFAGEDLVVLARYDGSGNAGHSLRWADHQRASHWSTRVNFPDRSRENPFVARLWATQRVGYLSAEKRKHGGSQEIDDEIRDLGERFGIPTEFSSYLVVEPGMNQRIQWARRSQLTVVVTGAGTTGAARLLRAAVQFEAAKSAAAQRSATNIVGGGLNVRCPRVTRNVSRAGNLTFVLRDSVWTDVRYKKSGTVSSG